MGIGKWMVQDIRDFLNEMDTKRKKIDAALKMRGLFFHERIYALMSAFLPHLFPLPKEKPFPRYMGLDMAFSFLLFCGLIYVGIALQSMDYSCYGGDVNMILEKNYGIGSVAELTWCKTMLDLRDNGSEFNAAVNTSEKGMEAYAYRAYSGYSG